jgi:hypothetical protein
MSNDDMEQYLTGEKQETEIEEEEEMPRIPDEDDELWAMPKRACGVDEHEACESCQ